MTAGEKSPVGYGRSSAAPNTMHDDSSSISGDGPLSNFPRMVTRTSKPEKMIQLAHGSLLGQ
jgi:hypothetical protein